MLTHVHSDHADYISFLYEAMDENTAIHLIHSKMLNELVEARQIETKDEKYYLSFVGKTVAEGALKIYPELKWVVKGLT